MVNNRFYSILISLIVTFKSLIMFSQSDTLLDRSYLLFDIESPPFYKGGYNEMNKFIESQIIYPFTGIYQKIEGKVILECLVDTTGSVFDCKVLKGIREDFDKEAIRVAGLVKFHEPAKQMGKPVCTKFIFHIYFHLPKEQKTKHKK